MKVWDQTYDIGYVTKFIYVQFNNVYKIITNFYLNVTWLLCDQKRYSVE